MSLIEALAEIVVSTAPPGFAPESPPQWTEENEDGTTSMFFENFLEAAFESRQSGGSISKTDDGYFVVKKGAKS